MPAEEEENENKEWAIAMRRPSLSYCYRASPHIAGPPLVDSMGGPSPTLPQNSRPFYIFPRKDPLPSKKENYLFYPEKLHCKVD